MASVNKVILIGNLGKDPEAKFLANGDAVTNITVATSESWKDKATGEKKESTEWHRVTFFGKLAEVAGQYLAKGSSVYLEGKLKTRKWQDKDGADRYTTEIIAHEMKMLGKKGDVQPQTPVSEHSEAKGNAFQPQGGGAGFEDDIPFAPIGRGAACHVI